MKWQHRQQSYINKLNYFTFTDLILSYYLLLFKSALWCFFVWKCFIENTWRFCWETRRNQGQSSWITPRRRSIDFSGLQRRKIFRLGQCRVFFPPVTLGHHIRSQLLSNFPNYARFESSEISFALMTGMINYSDPQPYVFINLYHGSRLMIISWCFDIVVLR